jgi:hypothetical protein
MIHQNESVEGNVTNSWWKKWQPKFMYTFSISFISTHVQFLRLFQWKVDISLQETCISTKHMWVKWYAGWDSAWNWKYVYRKRISYNAYGSQRTDNKYLFGSEQELQIFMHSFGSFEIHQCTMYLIPHSNENNKKNNRNKCDSREKHRCRILKRN